MYKDITISNIFNVLGEDVEISNTFRVLEEPEELERVYKRAEREISHIQPAIDFIGKQIFYNSLQEVFEDQIDDYYRKSQEKEDFYNKYIEDHCGLGGAIVHAINKTSNRAEYISINNEYPEVGYERLKAELVKEMNELKKTFMNIFELPEDIKKIVFDKAPWTKEIDREKIHNLLQSVKKGLLW